MRGADLEVADLSRASVSGANLSGAKLGTNPSRSCAWAILHNANLRYSDVSGADLRGADLTWANLTGADLTWANLTGASWGRTTCPDGSITDTGCEGRTLPGKGPRSVQP
jgi:uncharacterized protein YjbI with pentapeptide repeats